MKTLKKKISVALLKSSQRKKLKSKGQVQLFATLKWRRNRVSAPRAESREAENPQPGAQRLKPKGLPEVQALKCFAAVLVTKKT